MSAFDSAPDIHNCVIHNLGGLKESCLPCAWQTQDQSLLFLWGVFQVKLSNDLINGTLVVTLPGACVVGSVPGLAGPVSVYCLLLLLGVRSLQDQSCSGDERCRLLQLLFAAVEFGRQGSADRPHVFSCRFVYCDWVRYEVWSVTSISLRQHVRLSMESRPWDTLACCRGHKQPVNNN